MLTYAVLQQALQRLSDMASLLQQRRMLTYSDAC
jgi:hypothetical protein